MNKNSYYNLIAEQEFSTVVSEYIPNPIKSLDYQSENALEKEFIKTLTENSYEYIKIRDNNDLVNNLKTQLEKLNNYTFSKQEWQNFFDNYIANKNDGIKEKSSKIQKNHIYNIARDNGSTKNIKIIDKTNIHNNSLQVINQYTTEGNYKNRYDVTILVNGLPLVHTELKRRGVSLKEAFNQINRYQKDSFWADSGLFEYIQIFVISNGTFTKYYSNTTRDSHINENLGKNNKKNKTSHSFEFTCWWADSKNRRITELIDFAKTFFSKHSILAILTKYCIFTTDEILLVMRPYQIVATEQIVNKIIFSTNHKQLGTVNAGGYIWHTTGSGKTLTSFKTAQLVSKLDYIKKVLFVVDRKDLDYQTIREYNNFEEGSANSNTSTQKLTQQLNDNTSNIIITTIQKLSNFIQKNKNSSNNTFNNHTVLIFDECHRSQFGDMHTAITKYFKNYNIFGFTGTPIFIQNSTNSSKNNLITTEQAFGKKLHSYTIVDAINDKNVLPFKIDYLRTIKEKENVQDKKVRAIDTEKALNDPKRISLIVDYIITHFAQKTKQNSQGFHFSKLTGANNKYSNQPEQKIIKTTKGFNSIFAVSSIASAKLYYEEFKKRQSNLKIAIIYSFNPNEEESSNLDEESFDTSSLDKNSRDFLETAINDYNQFFEENYSTESEKFENYYKNLSLRTKNKEIDILIVVNMFLTGFDATTLNTLWIDKNLKYHGLLQAFSRTNRIFNSVKTFGNIVCFRNLEENTNEALALFGNENAKGTVILNDFNCYYRDYEKLVNQLLEQYPLNEEIKGEENKNIFIRLWGDILKQLNVLNAFDEFATQQILSERQYQDYSSIYITLYEERKNALTNNDDKENINDDVEFEMELAKQTTVDIDHILQLVLKYYKENQDKEVLTSILKAVDSSIELRNKKDLIEKFVNSEHNLNTNNNHNIYENWYNFMEENKNKELKEIIQAEGLEPKLTEKFIENSFQNRQIKTTGTDLTNIIPPMSRFNKKRKELKKKIENILKKFLERYL